MGGPGRKEHGKRPGRGRALKLESPPWLRVSRKRAAHQQARLPMRSVARTRRCGLIFELRWGLEGDDGEGYVLVSGRRVLVAFISGHSRHGQRKCSGTGSSCTRLCTLEDVAAKQLTGK